MIHEALTIDLPVRPRAAAVPAAVPAAVDISFFRGTPSTLTEADLVEAAKTIGCDIAAIKAVHSVETAGTGFRKDGIPTFRFEAHVFERETGQIIEGHPNKPDTLIRAGRENLEAMIMSTSWGLGQIMGFNATRAGCDTPLQLLEEARSGELAQLRHMIAFIRFRRLDGHLRAGDWARFARGYNGSDYRRNDYDGKLARAYARFAGQPSWVVLDLGDSGPQVKRLQEALKAVGFQCSDDGHFGPETESSLRAFQQEQGLTVDGVAGARTWERLREAGKIEKTRETAPPPPPPDDDVFDDALEKVRDIGGAAGAVGYSATDGPLIYVFYVLIGAAVLAAAIGFAKKLLSK